MPDFGGLIKENAAYFFLGVAVAWIGVAALENSALLTWPVVACLAGGALVTLRPEASITFAWAVSTASMGLIISAYEVYAWSPLLGGDFSSTALAPVVGFAAFAVVHLFLFYAGAFRPKVP